MLLRRVLVGVGACAASAVAGAAALAATCETEPEDFEQAQAIPNPFSHQALVDALPERLASEQQLRQYLQVAQPKLQELYSSAKDLPREEFHKKILALRERINLDTQVRGTHTSCAFALLFCVRPLTMHTPVACGLSCRLGRLLCMAQQSDMPDKSTWVRVFFLCA